MYRNLSEFIGLLEKENELVRVGVPVSTELEIAELTDRQCKRPGGGKALLFENCGYGFPVLTNMMGSDRRIALALGVGSLGELTSRIENLFAELTAPKASFYDKLRVLPALSSMAKWFPREKKSRGACQEVVLDGADGLLDRLPVLKCAPLDGGRFITLPMVNTEDPATGVRNVGMYRMQLFSDRTAGMHWHCHKTGERHYRAYRERQKRMPVTVTLGGDPAYIYAATAPLPDNIDEYLLAGFIRKRPVELVKCLTNDLYVPSDCDFVIEGYVDPAEDKVTEGPFGDHTGFYSLEDSYPLFHVTCITHRKNAVYPATVVGIPPQEDAYIAKATERIFLAPVRLAVQPEVQNIYLPDAGVAHNLTIVDIRKSYPGQAFKTANALWGAGQMMFNKFMFVTSGLGSRITDPAELKKALARVSVADGLLYSKGPLDVLDHAAPRMGFGGKLVVDATERLPENETSVFCAGAFDPEGIVLTEGIHELGTSFMKEGWPVLVAKAGSGVDLRQLAGRFFSSNDVLPVRFLVFFDTEVDLSDPRMLIWLAGNHIDPLRDTYVHDEKILVLDARVKQGSAAGFTRRWPNPVVMDGPTVRKVDARWEEYGLGAFIPSPSLRYVRLVRGEKAAL